MEPPAHCDQSEKVEDFFEDQYLYFNDMLLLANGKPND